MKKKEISIKIADICLNFRFNLKSKELLNLLNKRYHYFFTAKKSTPVIEVDFYNSKKTNTRIEIEDRKELTIIKDDFVFNLNKQKTRAGLFISSIYSFDNFLRIYISHILNKTDGLLLHSLGISSKGKGFIFAGKSGSGKTTISRILKQCEYKILTDELLPVRVYGEKAFLFSSPFLGEMKNPYQKPETAILKKLFFIKKSNNNFEKDIPLKYAVLYILRCAMNFSKENTITEQIIKKAYKLLNFPHSILYFQKSKKLSDYLKSHGYR